MIELPVTPPILNARRLPTYEEMTRQAANTHGTFRPGDLVLQPDTWGTVVMIVGIGAGEYHSPVEVGLAARDPDGHFVKGHPFSGSVPASALIRVCRYCLDLDLSDQHPPVCGPAAAASPENRRRVPITATDISSSATTFYVDVTDNNDALIIIDIDGYDVVGLDLNAGTVGIWVGDDPDNREWTVVDRFTPFPAGTSAVGDGGQHRVAPSGSALADAVVATIPRHLGKAPTVAAVLADAAEPPQTDEPFALPDCGA